MRSLSTQVLIIGGGVTGLGIAWDACLRGLKVLLIEQGDIAEGTTGRYHGLLHSGGRYALTDPKTAVDCSTENKTLRRIAPGAIEATGGLFLTLPQDPPDYSERWLQGVKALRLPVDEIQPSQSLHLEPSLNSGVMRAFLVDDAALDSFYLLHSLLISVRALGGQVWLRHRVERLLLESEKVVGARVVDLSTGEQTSVGAEIVVNSTGPWLSEITAMAGIELQMVLSKGVLLAMTSRLNNTVLNRCRPPSDGDIVVPVGPVSILGTTDTRVQSPTDHRIKPKAIDLLLSEGEVLLPELRRHRPLRAWAGIRSLLAQGSKRGRALRRGNIILDHQEEDRVAGLVSVSSGKLTTFRLVAEKVVDLLCTKLLISEQSSSSTTELITPRSGNRSHSRTTQLPITNGDSTNLICECEGVDQQSVEEAILESKDLNLDDIRRDLRLGMGPCQGGFCAYRTVGIASRVAPWIKAEKSLAAFVLERWKGVQPLGWGRTLRQIELNRRIYFELLCLQESTGENH